MAEITYEPTEWADFEQGGTPITAASLNHMEGGIAGAIRGVNTLTEDRLQTYRVSQDGDTATQDVSGNAIVGPCLIYDEAINGTYYEPSSDVGDRVLMVSANQIKALQDSVSYKIAENLVVHARYGVATIALTNFKPTSNVAAGGKLFDFPSGTLPKSMRPGTELCLTTFGSTSLPAVLYVSRNGAMYMTVANAWESGWGFTASATWTTA